MPNTLDNPTTRLRIWQQNLNTSSDTQHCVISRPTTARDWDIVAIQEPTINAKGNTRATHDWHVVASIPHAPIYTLQKIANCDPCK
ncbi:hypothetical protein CY34DRAFT_95010 [Suillus luteus UH-Slu-Lm8-n1]|uniref:Endonuclease/exonuclease/phosphatase domain-containing protein n=1 Tax=Suillus luteus UH-Slu-Lm8-n1 TaxID=930992 RepID=A0A0D0ADA0_9AGAM|nr:hypothetical protein CY34DRAFT_95010 [Suillus luteus UH-Slu-Lm8-n1]